MKRLANFKRAAAVILISVLFVSVNAQELNKQAFDMLDLNYRGLEKVKEALSRNDDKAAAEALLAYYRTRAAIILPDVDLETKTISKDDQRIADEALEHKFFVHSGYQPSYFYGKDIDWTYWPVKDNELRWQLHRHKWFTSLAKAYRASGDEKYVQAWIGQLRDWIKKNPCPAYQSKPKPIGAPGNPHSDEMEFADENARFAWRPLEVSERINSQPEQFLLFLPSKDFTSEFLLEFLANYHLHCDFIMNNFSAQGNHLLFEAQRLLQAGIFFPEFKDAAQWRKNGIEILNREIKVQVYDDGMQFELDPHYHLAAINIFFKALQAADVNGYRNEFPQSYINTIEKMIIITMNMSFPDYTKPMFSDNRKTGKSALLKNYKDWSKVFSFNKQIAYFATEGKEGEQPDYISKAFKTSGFYMLRNGWDMTSTVMVLKAGPPAFWHNQPDNGTFDLFINGRSFFFDSGCYVYGGDDAVLKQRDWFRQTMIHNTLTLNNKNLETTDSKCLLWKTGDKTDILVVENPSYEGLKHRRSVFFVDKTYFVIVDEAIGNATGKVGIHFQMGETNVKTFPEKNGVYTTYPDNNNIVLRTFGSNPLAFEKEEGWVSYEYRKKQEREAFSFNINKTDDAAVRFITVIMPVKNAEKAPAVLAKISKAGTEELTLDVTMGKEKRVLTYSLYTDETK
jgi:heparan-sulfate lyase